MTYPPIFRQRLFWKILLGVWAMFVVILLAIWFTQALYNERNREQYARDVQSWDRAIVHAAPLLLRFGGRPALDEFVVGILGTNQDQLLVRPAMPGEETAEQMRLSPLLRYGAAAARSKPAPLPIVVTVPAPDGIWRVTYRPHRTEFDSFTALPYLIPRDSLISQAVASLVFSALLAWYLTRPIQKLRAGFGRLAQGDLNTRLNAHTWKRRDEITDLARDFDLVAQQLQKLVAAREQILRDVSHELRTPLARLRVAIDLAQQDSVNNLSESLLRIDSESKRINDLVGELLTLSRAESGAPMREQYVDVPELLRTVVQAARMEADHVGVTITESIDLSAVIDPRPGSEQQLPALRGDAELLRRAVENVLRNALRFSSRGGIVTVGLTATLGESRAYTIDVCDRGPGVPDEALGAIFEPFVRVSSGGSGEGIGLGLAIARRALLAHGGSISANNLPDGGLRVAIRLPF
jgi:two-component system, OmpR family, sensor kinase